MASFRFIKEIECKPESKVVVPWQSLVSIYCKTKGHELVKWAPPAYPQPLHVAPL